jgi:hypothetical protein
MHAQHVPRVDEHVTEAEYAGMARLTLVVAILGAAVCPGAGGEREALGVS